MMNDKKLAVIELLRGAPESRLRPLVDLRPRARKHLLRWLDQGGLAVYLAGVLDGAAASVEIDERLRGELTRRRRDNQARTRGLFHEFARVIERLNCAGEPYAILKGFSLTPDFCAAVELRHQTDIDVLLQPAAAAQAVTALGGLGYEVECTDASGEIRLATPSPHVPSVRDYIYGNPWQHRVELHFTGWERLEHVEIAAGESWLDRRAWRDLNGICFPVLAVADCFIHQMLHVFRHVLQGWIRLAWLLETATFLRVHAGNTGLWEDVAQQLRRDDALRNACALVLEMTRRIYQAEVPAPLARLAVDLPSALREWVAREAVSWALAEMPGDHRSLLVHREFVASPRAWSEVRRARLRRIVGNVSFEKLLSPAFLARALRQRAGYAWTRLRWAWTPALRRL